MWEDRKFDISLFLTISASVLFLLLILPQSSENVLPTVLAPSRSGDQSGTPPLGVSPDWKEYSIPTLGLALKYPTTMTYHEWKSTADILHSVSFYLTDDIRNPLFKVP